MKQNIKVRVITDNLKITVKNGKRRVTKAGLKRTTELSHVPTTFRNNDSGSHKNINTKKVT
jgi:hypothetical protein